MNLEERISQTQKRFEETSKQRTDHIAKADECLVELNRLQGEYRLLQELKDLKVIFPKEVSIGDPSKVELPTEDNEPKKGKENG